MTDLRTDYASVPGLEARHEWDGGVVILNDSQGTLPRSKMSKIGGLHSLPDNDFTADMMFGRSGEIPRSGQRRGKTVTYEGKIEAKTLESLRYRAGVIRAAFAAIDERQMRIIPHPTYGGKTYRYKGRATALEIADDNAQFNPQAVVPFSCALTLAIRASDGRMYSDETITVASAAGAGADITVNVTNPGLADTDPLVTFYGPLVGARLSRPGVVFAFKDDVTIGAGNHFTVDFATRRIYDNAGALQNQYLDPVATTWWDANQVGLPAATTAWTLSQAAGHPGVGSSFHVAFSPAVW